MVEKAQGSGARDDPWRLKTPSGQSALEAYRDEQADPPALVVIAAKTEVRYLLGYRRPPRHAQDPRRLDAAGQSRRAETRSPGTVEAWARSPENPVGGWYGLKKGLRGRFANYVPPCSRRSGWRRWSTTPEATACGPSRARHLRKKRPALPLRAAHRGRAREPAPGTARGRYTL